MRDLPVPSDILSPLRDLFSHLVAVNSGWAAVLDMPLQIRVVIDANKVLADLVWMVRDRRTPSARNALQEGIDSGTVVAFVPLQLREEVEEHIPEFAKEKGLDVQQLRQAWESYQPCLRFWNVGPLPFKDDGSTRDPTDLPYTTLATQIGAVAIVSSDKDIPAMGWQTIGREVELPLRDYARAASCVLTLQLGGTFVTIVVTDSALWLLRELIVPLAQSFARLPVSVRLVALAGVGTAVGIGALHTYSRAMMGAKLAQCYDVLRLLGPMLASMLRTLAGESMLAAAAQRKVEHELPRLTSPQRTPLETLAFSVCVAAGEPLTLHQIERGVLRGGYASKSQYRRDYLRRVLRKSPRLVCGTDGLWSTSPCA